MSTLREIAEVSGVSIGTVSRILTGKAERHSEATCTLVLRVAEQLGYRRNTFASGVRSGTFGGIGLLRSSNPVHSKIPEGFRNRLDKLLQERNLLFLSAQMDEESLSMRETLPKILRDWTVDGILFFYTHGHWGRLETYLERQKIPAVWVNNKLPRNSVYPDDLAGGEMAAEYLIERGHRKIACYSHAYNDHYSEVDRRKGFIETARKSGCTAIDYTAKADHPKRDWMKRATETLQNLKGATALFCYGPTEVSCLYLAATLLGIRIPKDIELIAIHPDPVDVNGISVPTLQMPFDGIIADTALDELQKQIAGAGGFKSKAIKPVWVMGDRR
jgi:LacI family transcriptional regulator